jgi:TatD DNase family protein
MKIIDSHCHLNISPLVEQIDKIIADANAVGVQEFIIPGIMASQWDELLLLARRHIGIYCAAGLHPLFLEHHHQKDLIHLKKICQKNLLVAIGEVGLDFYHGRHQEPKQQQLFEQQLAIAKETKLPIILHVRKAHDHVLGTLRRKNFTCGGTVHAFNGSIQQAEHYIALGFAIGVGGAITYERATKLRAMATWLPEESIVLETDSPDMLITGKENGPNLPEYLIEILHVLSKLRQTTPEQLGKATLVNTHRVFKI